MTREKRRKILRQQPAESSAQGQMSLSRVAREQHTMHRKSNRFRTNGIVALTGLAQPVLSNIYDIGPGGLSFLHADAGAVEKDAFKMDILIYDSSTGFEYFIGLVKGRVVWRELVADPENNCPIWRFNVAFFDLDSSRQKKLHTLCDDHRTANIWFLDERLPKISYDF